MNPQRQLLSAVDMFIPEARRLYTDGAKIGQPREKQQFTQSASFIGASLLTPLATITVGVNIPSDRDFLAFNVEHIATLANNTTFVGLLPATMLLTAVGGSSQLSDQPQHIENYAGFGAWLPGTPPWPLWLPGGTVLQVQLTSLDAVNTYAVWVSFPGINIY